MHMNFLPDPLLPFQHPGVYLLKVRPSYCAQNVFCLITHTYFTAGVPKSRAVDEYQSLAC